MTPRNRQCIVAATLTTLGVGLAASWYVARPFVEVGAAYKAKVLCSEVFVAGRPSNEVSAGMLVDDLRALRWIRATVDSGTRTARARFFPLASRVARYEGAAGCVLAPPGETLGPVVGSSDDQRPVISAPHDTEVPLSPHIRAAIDSIVDDAFAEPNPDRPRRTRAVVILHHGSLVAERYADGIGPETRLIGWSMTKSVVNALIGIATGQGVLALDAPASVPEWGAPGDMRARITVSDLLRMSSGLRFGEGQADPRSDLFKMLYGARDAAAVAINQPLEAQPGTRWQYSSGTSVILCWILRRALGEEAYRSFPRRSLFEPLGMQHALIETDATGTFVGSSYMYATAREWARFGQLYLQDGVWAGHRLLPPGWVKYTRTPAPAAPALTYGAHFWLRTPEEYRGPAVPLPAGIFQAVGHEGQFVTVIPSDDVVIVRLGRTRFPEAWAHDRFVARVLAALRS